MLIQRLLEDPNGTIVTFGHGFHAVQYHFKPELPGGPHVSEVTDEAHIERFLSIPEGYRPAPGQPAAPAPQTQTTAPADPTQPTEPTEPTESTAVAIQTPPMGAAPAQATAPVEPPVAAGWDAVADDQLRDMFEREIGRKPHHRASRETMIAQIEAKRRGE